MRPIVITALALMGGSTVILTDPIFQGMAISLFFGVLIATLLTLIVIPMGCDSWGKLICETEEDGPDSDTDLVDAESDSQTKRLQASEPVVKNSKVSNTTETKATPSASKKAGKPAAVAKKVVPGKTTTSTAKPAAKTTVKPAAESSAKTTTPSVAKPKKKTGKKVSAKKPATSKRLPAGKKATKKVSKKSTTAKKPAARTAQRRKGIRLK